MCIRTSSILEKSAVWSPPTKSSRLFSPSASTAATGATGLPQLGDLQPVRLRAVAHAFLAAGERLGDGADAHALAGELVKLLDFVLAPGLAVAFELFAVGHRDPPLTAQLR